MTGHHAPTQSSGNSSGSGTPELPPCSALEIDRSCRVPVLVFLAGASAWMFVGLLLGLVSSIKLHSGNFLAHSAWLTYGRVFPASMNALIYGFAIQAALGIGLWMMARLSRTLFVGPFLATLSALFWNLGVGLGVIGILNHGGTGHEWLEMPEYAPPLLLFAYLLIGACGIVTFHLRRERVLYVSQWYLLAALFWFPWIYSTAELLLVYFPVRGVVQAVIGGWYTHNLFNLFLASMALAAIFYFIPKILGRPLHSRNLALFGFWTLALIGGWGGLDAGAPVPKWVASVGITAGVLMLIPLLSVALNWHLTINGDFNKALSHPILRFVLAGAASYLLGSLLEMLGQLRLVGHVVQLTLYHGGVANLQLFGFLGLVLGGATYYIAPRVAACECLSPKSISFHFWTAALGAMLASLPLVLGGLRQGIVVNDPDVAFVDAVRSALPFIGMSTLGILLLLMASAAFFWNLATLVVACLWSACCAAAFRPAPAQKPSAAGVNS